MDAVDLLDLRDKYRADYADFYEKHALPIQTVLNTIDRAIAEKYTETAKLAFEKANKTDGKVAVDLPGGLKLSASVSKRVDWDSDKLLAVAKNMPWADVQHYFKFDLGVSENIYKSLPPSSEFKAKLDDARAVKLGDMKITLERKDAAPADQSAGG